MSYLVNFGEHITETQFDISLAHSVAEGNRSRVLPTVIFRQLDLSEYGIHRFAYSSSSRKYYFISNNTNLRGLYWCDSLENRPTVYALTLPSLGTTEVLQDLEVVDDVVIVASFSKIWYSEDLGRMWYTHDVGASILTDGKTVASIAFTVTSSPQCILFGLSEGAIYSLDISTRTTSTILSAATNLGPVKFSSTNDVDAPNVAAFNQNTVVIINNDYTNPPSATTIDLLSAFDTDSSSVKIPVPGSTNLEYMDVCYREEAVYVFAKNLDNTPNTYYYIAYNISTAKASFYDFEPFDISKSLMVCALDNIEYFDFAPVVLINGGRYRLFTETVRRALPEEFNYVNRVDNKFIQLSNSKIADSSSVFTTYVSEMGHQISSDVTASGLSPDKVFRTDEDKGEGNVQIRGVASGENSLVIDSDVVVDEDNMMAIGHSTNYRYRFGQLEFYVTAEKLIITMIPDQSDHSKNKSFEFLWPTNIGPPIPDEEETP
jgi:hypothetical protein